ncbi:MAG: cupredoxin domain-containing protein [Actinomycetota bacterium]
MRSRRATVGVAAGLAFVAGLVLPPTGAGALTTYEIQAGRVFSRVSAESMRFRPSAIDVHQGDTLHFTNPSVHTATFLPVGEGVVDWFEANAVLGSSGPYSLIRPDRDDGPRSFKFTNAAFFATDETCGGPSQPACSFDGSSVLNSGLGWADFTVDVDVAQGNEFWVVCLIHGPPMRLKVTVVPNAQPASAPAELAAANAAAIQQDRNASRALRNRFIERRTSHLASGVGRVWDAWAGVDGAHVSVYGMFPSKLVVDKGDTVQWHFDSLVFEDHTVSIPVRVAEPIAAYFETFCDPDGDGGLGPDNPPDMPDPPFCTDPTEVELELHDRFTLPRGNGLFGGAPLETSGVLGANSILGDPDFELKFTKRSSSGGFRYMCMIHPGMRGRVVVV